MNVGSWYIHVNVVAGKGDSWREKIVFKSGNKVSSEVVKKRYRESGRQWYPGWLSYMTMRECILGRGYEKWREIGSWLWKLWRLERGVELLFLLQLRVTEGDGVGSIGRFVCICVLARGKGWWLKPLWEH